MGPTQRLWIARTKLFFRFVTPVFARIKRGVMEIGEHEIATTLGVVVVGGFALVLTITIIKDSLRDRAVSGQKIAEYRALNPCMRDLVPQLYAAKNGAKLTYSDMWDATDVCKKIMKEAAEQQAIEKALK